MKNFLERPRRVFKASCITFPPNTPHKTQRNHLPNHRTPCATPRTPTSQQLPNRTRHNPTETQTADNGVPQGIRHSAMKEKIIHRLPIRLTKPTSVNHYHASPAKIIDGEDLTSSDRPSKKRNSRWSLRPPNAFPRERNGPMRQENPIVRSNLEGTFARRNPPQLVLPNPSELIRI
jgi:hypothetical protein